MIGAIRDSRKCIHNLCTCPYLCTQVNANKPDREEEELGKRTRHSADANAKFYMTNVGTYRVQGRADRKEQNIGVNTSRQTGGRSDCRRNCSQMTDLQQTLSYMYLYLCLYTPRCLLWYAHFSGRQQSFSIEVWNKNCLILWIRIFLTKVIEKLSNAGVADIHSN